MTQESNAVDITPAQLKEHRKTIEDTLSNFNMGAKHSLADLLREIDPDEQHIMGDVERQTYKAVRTGLEIFSEVTDLLSKKVGLKELLIKPGVDPSNDPEIITRRDFAQNYATFAASQYVSRKLGEVLANSEEDLLSNNVEGISLQTASPKTTHIKRLLVPLYVTLTDDKNKGTSPTSFAKFTKDVFDKYVDLTSQNQPTNQEFLNAINHHFRIDDEYLTLHGFENMSSQITVGGGEKPTFQRIDINEIVGNHIAKREIYRFSERLCLYDPVEKMNPVLQLGGLSWSVLFDGPPGTGKTSMFRLGMTRISDLAEQVGIPFNIAMIDNSVKSEYYGKTAQILREKLSITKLEDQLTMVVLDDIDLLTSSRGDAQGADNDINDVLMQYLDGAMTVRRGNVINYAASNDPTGLDNAMRNRFRRRLLVDGPTTPEDFADIMNLFAKDLIEAKLMTMDMGYTPFETQAAALEKGKDCASSQIAQQFEQYSNANIYDFGKFMTGLKEQNELITGRSANAIIESCKERAADFDVPSEWFSDRSVYFEQPYANKVSMLTELYHPITPQIVFEEAQNYFDSEQRYANAANDERIAQIVKEQICREGAQKILTKNNQ